MRVAWFCTLLTRSKLDLAVVPHAVMPYSSTGVTLPLYSLLIVTVCAPCRACQFLRESHLGSDFSCLSLLFPRQLVEIHPQVGGVVLSKQSFRPLISRLAFCSFVERLKVVFLVLILTSHRFVQPSKMLSACCSM